MDPAFLAPEDIELPPSPPELADTAPNNISVDKSKPKILQLPPESFWRSTESQLTFDNDGSPKASNLIITTIPSRPRNHSPYSRTHYRSRSTASPLGMAPQMARAHSSPGIDSSGRIYLPGSARPSSPLGPFSGRRQSPLRTAIEEPYLSNYVHASSPIVSQPIAEYSTLDVTPRTSTILNDSKTPPSPLLLPSIHHTFPRSRRRPSSPLHHAASAPSFNTLTGMTSSAASPISFNTSPFMAPSTKFVNEPYPLYTSAYPYSYSSSSMPSTPTSMRSRSPSISSLETIPDDTDAEEAAIAAEAERLAQLKAQAIEDGDEGDGEKGKDGRRRTSLDVPGRAGVNSKRKRWSVCGAERRGDLDLETIWED